MKIVFSLSIMCFFLSINAQKVDSFKVQNKLDSLDKVVVGYLNTVDFEQMFTTLDQALIICESAFGKQSIPYTKILNRYGDCLTRLGKYQEADSIFMIAEEIWANQPIKDHDQYGDLISNIGVLYTNLGRFEEAQEKFEISLPILEKSLGINHTKYAQCLNRYGILNYHEGNINKAKDLWQHASDIWLDVDGVESGTYSASLHNLGNINTALSRYEDAEQFFKEAVRIRKKILSKNDPQYGISILNLGTTYARIGKSELVEPLFNEAIMIFKNSIGEEHPFYLDCLNNFAIFYNQIGDYDKAIVKQTEVLRIQERVIGKQHPRYARYLATLAGFYKSVGNFKSAIQSLEEALLIIEENHEENKIELIFILQTLGETYAEKENLKEAEIYFLEVKDHLLQENMENSIENARNSFALGNLYITNNQIEIGIEYLEKSKKLYLEIHGVKETNYGSVVNKLATIYSNEGNVILGQKYFIESHLVAKQLVIEGAAHLSEKEMGPFLNKFNHIQSEYLTVGRTHDEFASLAYDNALFYKGYLLNSIVKRNIVLKQDTSNQEDILRLKSIKRILADNYSRPAIDRESTVDLEEEANTLEKALLRNVKGLNEYNTIVKWQDVQHKLDGSSVAIEFVHFNSSLDKETTDVEYGALVVRGDKKEPVYVSLFNDNMFIDPSAYEDQVSYINELYNTSIGEENILYKLIYKPLENALKGITNIYYSPTGVLHRMNLSAIKIDEKLLFGDKYNLFRLGSTRQLAFDNDIKTNDKIYNAYLFGGIEYDYNPKIEQKNIQPLTELEETNEFFGTENDEIASRSIIGSIPVTFKDSIKKKEAWQFLKWTQVELDAIELILEDAQINTQIFKGYEGSEEAFKYIEKITPSPSILHIATHGYFFENIGESYSQNIDKAQSYKTSDHSMIRSGLVMAKGNYAWQNGGPIMEGAEDGILTSYEISQLNLSNIKLAVLSACETGLGDIKETEGVYGLQRAFKIAGVEKIIMSLWQVSDFHTQELMSSFYYNWQIGEMSISEAFKTAQNSIKKRYPEPFYWAGFVLVE